PCAPDTPPLPPATTAVRASERVSLSTPRRTSPPTVGTRDHLPLPCSHEPGPGSLPMGGGRAVDRLGRQGGVEDSDANLPRPRGDRAGHPGPLEDARDGHTRVAHAT